MTAKDPTNFEDLKTGQLWKTENRFLQVTDVGRILVHYQLLTQPDRKAAATRVATRRAMVGYLMRTKATLFIINDSEDIKSTRD